LLLEICRGLRKSSSQLALNLAACGFHDRALTDFGATLELSMQPSVDAFLEHRREFEALGKAAIAGALLPYEKPEALLVRAKSPSWYEFLFSRMADTGHFIDNCLLVITFNYDRSLEHFLTSALRNSYGMPDEEIAQILRRTIVHVYGSLGEIPLLGGTLDYTGEVTPSVIQRASESIQIIYEGSRNREGLEVAQEALRQAEIVCFLGFGYHVTNLQNLRLPEILHGRPVGVWGSAFEVGAGERARIHAALNGLNTQLGAPGLDALGALRDFPVLL
jgi:hypothetical protein